MYKNDPEVGEILSNYVILCPRLISAGTGRPVLLFKDLICGCGTRLPLSLQLNKGQNSGALLYLTLLFIVSFSKARKMQYYTHAP